MDLRTSMTRRVFQDKIVHRSLTLAFLFVVTLTVSAQWAAPQGEGGVPAYNAAPPAKGTKLPPILSKADLWGPDAQYPYQTHAYELAAKIPNVIHQQPCYCYCDRMGHNSLHSCFDTLTAPSARPASRSFTTPTSKTKKERRHHRSARESSRASGNRST